MVFILEIVLREGSLLFLRKFCYVQVLYENIKQLAKFIPNSV